ncbi:MAG: hypothetical protein KAX10_03310 [Candidatus Lokiarchaeota archaeon]|nr:hypothetical protein [Candidatus Lokiarchaeota archaeon]
MSESKRTLELWEIPFMQFGIISSHSFSSLSKVPIKRWDPLSNVPIILQDNGKHTVLSKFYGHYSYISPVRRKRESNIDKDNGDNDVFKAVLNGKPIKDNKGNLIGDGFGIIICNGNKKVDNPFSITPKRYINIKGKAITLINRYPAMARWIEDSILDYIVNNLPLNSKLAYGVNLVTISKEYYDSLKFEEIPDDVISEVFQSTTAGISYVIEEANKKGIKSIPVSPFFNIGKPVGGSQRRLHSQVYIDLNEDGHGARLEMHLKAFEEMREHECRLCKSDHGGGSRLVLKTNFWTFFVTGSPLRNYHLRFYPNEHLERLDELDKKCFNDLAHNLKIIWSALNDIFANPNRNIILNMKPYGYEKSHFHLFGDILPYEFVGGAEMADDMRVARLLPENVAKELRKIIHKKDLISKS